MTFFFLFYKSIFYFVFLAKIPLRLLVIPESPFINPAIHKIGPIGIIKKLKNENSFVIAIDAALSCNSNRIGKIIVNQNKMNVGNSMNKKQLYIGDISIKGIVGKDFKNSRNNFNALQNMPLNIIIDMAECVSTGIYNVINV